MKVLGSILGLLIVASLACGEPPNPQGPAHGLSLNNGSRWQVDDHTRASTAKMIALEQTYPKFSSSDDAIAFGLMLEAEVQNLIRGCTMEGASHDQLHVFLSELIPLINELKGASDIESARGMRATLASLFKAYDSHFE